MSSPRRQMPIARRLNRAFRYVGAGLSRARNELIGPFDATDSGPFRDIGGSSLFSDWVAVAMHPDEVYKWSAERIRNRAQDLAASNPYVHAYLSILPDNVIGPNGLTLQAQIRSGGDGDLIPWINDRIETGWTEFWLDPFVDHRLTGVHGEHNAIKSLARDGEFGIRFHRGFRGNRFGLGIQLVDSCMIETSVDRRATSQTREVRLGVEVDGWGAPLGYYLKSEYGGRPEYVSARDFLHVYDPDRINQTRGISWLAPIMGPAWLLERYEEAEVTAARVAAAKSGFFQTRDGVEIEVPDLPDDADSDEQNPLKMSADPGVAHQLDPGWEFVPWSPEHPSTAFPAFVKTQIRKISAGLSVSYSAISGDLEGTSYSSGRTGLIQERQRWRTLQTRWRDTVRRRCYRELMDSALLSGAIRLDSRDFEQFLSVRWTAQGMPWVDPKNDLEAAEIAMRLGLTSRTRELAEIGEDFEDICEERAEEKRLAEMVGLDFEPAPKGAAAANGSSSGDTGNGNNGNGGSNNAADGRTTMSALRNARRRHVRRLGHIATGGAVNARAR